MIKSILSLFTKEREPATSKDYDEVFNSPAGQRVMLDLAQRYNVGGSSFVFGSDGEFRKEASMRADTAKMIIQDIMLRAKFKPDASTASAEGVRKHKKLNSLPSSATQI